MSGTDILIPQKSKGGIVPPRLVISRVPWGVRKTLVWGLKVVGRGVVNDVFAKTPLYRQYIKEI